MALGNSAVCLLGMICKNAVIRLRKLIKANGLAPKDTECISLWNLIRHGVCSLNKKQTLVCFLSRMLDFHCSVQHSLIWGPPTWLPYRRGDGMCYFSTNDTGSGWAGLYRALLQTRINIIRHWRTPFLHCNSFRLIQFASSPYLMRKPEIFVFDSLSRISIQCPVGRIWERGFGTNRNSGRELTRLCSEVEDCLLQSSIAGQF